ncbi:MAG: NAD(P)-dependent alcohol dehydrogenase [Candidatus Nanopelagicaceae bacterium]|nr:NAD(P)-dependent alcohol dehydrogenase [Candidatus Nanopelagicaceae bacterium]
MKTRGYAVLQAKEPLVPFEFERRELSAKDVGFDIEFAGICHSDIHQAREEWGPALFPMVPGHEIVGTVTEIGAAVKDFQIGDRIGVGVFIDSCRNCENCKKGLQQYCLEGMTGTYNGYERNSQNIAFGGYSNKFVINEDYAVKVPANLDPAGVAPLLCAGITLYSPIKHWKVGPGSKVAVMGLGGLGHMGVKFAAALGAEVTVLSHSPNKASDAKLMGASNFVVTKESDWSKSYKKYFDLILNTVSADLDLEPYLNTLRTDGTLVVIGLPGKPYSVNAGTLLNGRRSISGSMIGGIPELQEMLDFCGSNNILSDVEIISADYINQAYDRTVASDVKYRFVIDAKTF